MLTFNEIKKLKSLYANGENVIQFIRNNMTRSVEEAILFSYDLQAGNYVKNLSDDAIKNHRERSGKKLAELFTSFGVKTICEAGVGEGTTLCYVSSNGDFTDRFGFDLSVSRLMHGKAFLRNNGLDADLFCSHLANIPFADDSVECMYTFHSCEPNGGKEKVILRELLRVTKNYLVLVEPDYEFFGESQKQRMDQHGYAKHLDKHLEELGANIIKYEQWELDAELASNRAGLIVVEKKPLDANHRSEVAYVSPISKAPLKKVPEGFYCPEDGFVFPIINELPVLTSENAILASRYEDFL